MAMKKFMKNKKFATVFPIAVALFFGAMFLMIPKAHGFMSSADYMIQFGNINMTSGTKTGGPYKITDTVGQTAPGRYGTTGYLVRAGFQYIYTIGTFSFSLSNYRIDFGLLSTNTFATATTGVTVSAKGAGGYIVTAYENAPLTKLGTAATIPNTTCNSGSCTYGTVGVWTDATKNGFGYTLSGNDIPAAFVDTTYFKPFADFSQNQPGQVIMSNAASGKNRYAVVTYKISVSGSQAAGDYENHIVYIATPGY
ncbi:MAG TPA: hypothetical protein DCX25_04925 [Candidatus Pacebacteria bacterium]|nr:hypothetical protein [Candidatus Paceibacterota bacterium]HCR11271.1 hypothetical protein [Candidatus Paceibacterota bacterium]